MEALQNLQKRKILLKALKLKKMNYLSSDIGGLEILEECILKTKDGREYDREYNSFWGEESTWRVPFRCKICPDAIGESADVAALDTWRGGSPKGEDEGFNAAIVRTKKGLDLMSDAAKAGFYSYWR